MQHEVRFSLVRPDPRRDVVRREIHDVAGQRCPERVQVDRQVIRSGGDIVGKDEALEVRVFPGRDDRNDRAAEVVQFRLFGFFIAADEVIRNREIDEVRVAAQRQRRRCDAFRLDRSARDDLHRSHRKLRRRSGVASPSAPSEDKDELQQKKPDQVLSAHECDPSLIDGIRCGDGKTAVRKFLKICHRYTYSVAGGRSRSPACDRAAGCHGTKAALTATRRADTIRDTIRRCLDI